MIDTLRAQAKEVGIAVEGFYYNFLPLQEQTTANMVENILAQLVRSIHISEYPCRAFSEENREIGGRRLRKPLVELLRGVISSLPQVFICIDGLDECLPENLLGLLESLNDIVREFPKTRVFLTGRPHVREDVERCFLVPITPKTKGIGTYLEMGLDRDHELEEMGNDLKAEVMRTILEKMSDTCVVLSFSEQLPIVYREAQERIKRRRRGTNYSLTCLLHLCLNRTLKYKSPDLLALIVFPLTSYHMVPLTLSSYPSLHRSSSHRFTPLFLTATPPFLHRYPALPSPLPRLSHHSPSCIR